MPSVKDRAERVLDYELQEQLHEYAGKWVVITSTEVIAVGDAAEDAWAKAVEAGVNDAALYRVPEKDTIFIL